MSDTKFHVGQLVKFDENAWPELINNVGIIVDPGETQNSCVRIYVTLREEHVFWNVDDIVFGFWPKASLEANTVLVDVLYQ